MNNNIYETLHIGEFCSPYFNPDDTCEHLTGYINCFNDNEILVNHINERGEYDGYIWKPMEALIRVEKNGSYEKKICKLYAAKGQEHKELNIDSTNILLSLLQRAKDNNLVVQIDLGDDSVAGFVKNINKEYVELQALFDDGTPDGISVCDLGLVKQVDCDGEYEQDIYLLYNSLQEIYSHHLFQYYLFYNLF